MLAELVVSNFAIIESLRMPFAPGLNVLTGETGAGKSIVIDAVEALLGGRCGAELVRAGAPDARVEGLFTLEPPAQAGDGEERSMQTILEEFGARGDDGTIILAREIHATGRTAARVNGRLVPVAILQQIAAGLVDIHGQGDHLSILRPSRHSWFLDRFAGLMERRQAVAAQAAELRRLRKEIAELQRDERELERRADLLRFQVAEIQSAALVAGEEANLVAEHHLLTHAEQLAEGASQIHKLLLDASDDASAVDRLSQAVRQAQQMAKLDDALSAEAKALQEAIYTIEDVAKQFRRYGDGIEFNPARVKQVEERLDLLHRLKRKYGNSIEEVIGFGEAAGRELDGVANSGERLADLRRQEGELAARLANSGEELSEQRRAAGAALARAVEAELAELNMARARLEVACERVEDAAGLALSDGRRYAWDLAGVDRVEFLIAPNPGEPPRPLAKIASGGETSRLMLALKAVLTKVDPAPTLIFDEIDAGIGGRTGQVLGTKLSQLGKSHQVLCVTHLPQIASYADTHFRVSKDAEAGRTTVAARQLIEDERAVEIAIMLGGVADSAAGLENARALIAHARMVKEQATEQS